MTDRPAHEAAIPDDQVYFVGGKQWVARVIRRSISRDFDVTIKRRLTIGEVRQLLIVMTAAKDDHIRWLDRQAWIADRLVELERAWRDAA